MKNKKVFWVFVILVIVILILVFFLFGQRGVEEEKKMEASQEEAMTEEPLMNKEDGSSVQKSSGKYVVYKNGVLEQFSGKRRVLFFYANWCPICRPADLDFQKNENMFPADVVLIRVNYNDPDTDNEEKELARKYEITYQHTFVQIDAEGNVIAKWNGGQTNQLLKNIK